MENSHYKWENILSALRKEFSASLSYILPSRGSWGWVGWFLQWLLICCLVIPVCVVYLEWMDLAHWYWRYYWLQQTNITWHYSQFWTSKFTFQALVTWEGEWRYPPPNGESTTFPLSSQSEKQNSKIRYRIVSNKRSPSNKRPLTYFQIKLGKMPKFLYGVSL